ncbi:MAG: hypothetical protein QOG23_3531 [Blastocatellia bacterium]|nr:hypothetical protein [Blastocatellia bacterium]
MNFADALRLRGDDVTLWSPQPLPQGTRWWQTLRAMRMRLDRFLKTHQHFDVIDCPSSLITRLVSRSATVVARNTQPDLLYLWIAINRHRDLGFKSVTRFPFECAFTFYHMFLVLLGWGMADRIMCLGNLELRWMNRWFPWWRAKLSSYFIGLSDEDQRALATVRRGRERGVPDQIRFLWIGRWEKHKGPGVLLDFITQWHLKRPQDTFTIAGCGPNAEGSCPAQLLRSGALKIILSFGRDELYRILAEHDVGLFTSKIEGWGLSLNEMLESGMTIFATEAGGANDLRSFFKQQVKPFPPSLRAITNLPVSAHPGENYYEEFTWKGIAEKYVRVISTELKLDNDPAQTAAAQRVS